MDTTSYQAISVVAGHATNAIVERNLQLRQTQQALELVSVLSPESGDLFATGTFAAGRFDKAVMLGHTMFTVPVSGEAAFLCLKNMEIQLGGYTISSSGHSATRVFWMQGDRANTMFCAAFGNDAQRVIISATLVDASRRLWDALHSRVSEHYQCQPTYCQAIVSGTELLDGLFVEHDIRQHRIHIQKVSFRIRNVRGLIERLPMNCLRKNQYAIAKAKDYDNERFRRCTARAAGLPIV